MEDQVLRKTRTKSIDLISYVRYVPVDDGNVESDKRRWLVRYRSILVGVNRLADVAVFGVVSVTRVNRGLVFRISLVEVPKDQLVFVISPLFGGVNGRLALMVIF